MSLSRDQAQNMQLYGMIAGAVVGGYFGGPGAGARFSGAAMGAGVGGAVGGAAQPAFGYDPEEEAMAEAKRVNDANIESIRQYQQQAATQFGEWERNAPLRQEFSDQYGALLRGESDATQLPMFQSMFANLNSSQTRARQNIMENMPAGGARERAMRNLSQSYGDSRAKAISQINQWVWQQAQTMNVPYNLPQPGQATPWTPPQRPGVDFGGLVQLGMMYDQNNQQRRPKEPEDLGIPQGIRG